MKKILTFLIVLVSLSSSGQMFYGHNQTSEPEPEQLGYGLLYNWYAASDANFAPSGWHVSNSDDWLTLTTYLGGEVVAGGKLKEAGTTHWNSPNAGATNETGFTALPGGYRDHDGTFNYFGVEGYFWNPPELNEYNVYYKYMNRDYSNLFGNYDEWKVGMSVRLLKNDSTNPGTMTDYDGNVYDCVTIDTQVWIVQNWHCKHLNDGTAIPEVTDNSEWEALTSGAWCYYNNDPACE